MTSHPMLNLSALPRHVLCIILACFVSWEILQARATLDMVNGHSIKVVPVVGPMLWGTVAEALAVAEPDWEQPKPEEVPRSGDWGSQRTILFSGLRQVLPQNITLCHVAT